MRGNLKNKLLNQILAVILSSIMVFGLIPVSGLSVLAAESEEQDETTTESSDQSGEILLGEAAADTVDAMITGVNYQEEGQTLIDNSSDNTVEESNEGYENSKIDTDPVIDTLSVAAATDKPEWEVHFSKYSDKEIFTFDETNTNIYDFSVEGTGIDSASVTYKIEDNSESEEVDDKDIATIDGAGQLTVIAPGSIKVIATIAENDAYSETTISSCVDIKTDGMNLINFNHSSISYILGTNGNIVSVQSATKKYADKDKGQLIYSAKIADSDKSIGSIGISIENSSGKVVVDNVILLADYMAKNGNSVRVEIMAEKAAYGGYNNPGTEAVYPAATAAYYIEILFETTPGNPFVLKDPDGNILTGPNGKDDWFDTAVTVVPAVNNYSIAKDLTGDFSDSVEFNDQGISVRNVYLKNTSTNGITGPINIGVEKIDSLEPVIAFSYSNGNEMSAGADNSQTATITVTEGNFQAEAIEVITTAKDITGQDITEQIIATRDFQDLLRNTTWSKEGDSYTATISDDFVKDAIYNMTFCYEDVAGHRAKEVNSGDFIVDHSAPDTSTMKVTYSTPILERIISAITFGYYQADVEVTFEASDMTSGIDYFTWSYTKENGTSDLNIDAYPDSQLTALQDSIDRSKYKASVTLPYEAVEQLRGNIAFTATDKYSNTSSRITDTGHIIVVDTISPTVTAEYTEPIRTIGNRMYYDGEVTAIFTVTEANFYAEDVVVELSKNGGAFQTITPAWKDSSTDVHTGTYTITAPGDHSGDADYIFRMTYTDRSNNQMETYTSDTIIIDTIKPVIDVVYSNNEPVNTLSDSENNVRQYFDATQTATITITEHNFEAGEVAFTILAKDAAGNELNANSLNSKSSWRTNGDKHVIVITYPGDANYIFDIAYADMASNDAEDYAEDYFTVDTTAPTNLNVSYSSSVLDTVLQGITFGFYNAQMTVTITADDSTSSVHGFIYNGTSASGVSAVNTEFINQAIDETGITYSNGRGTASIQFTIPSGALGSSSQFNGNVSFTAADRSGNESVQFNDNRRIVVDNISPTSNVTYNTPVQEAGGISYYDGPVTATVTVNEANFYAEDVQVSVTKDGAAYAVTPSWSNNSADVHVGTFNLSEDGDYFVTINYADKSSNSMAAYTSDQMTVDTEIVEPVITVNGEDANGKAFKDEVVPAVKFEDINFENYKINLSRTRYGDKDVDVTETFIGNNVTVNEQGGTGSFDTFAKEQDIDGIYTMTVSMEDKAGHTIETSSTFTVNRFGSVYEYSDYLGSLIKDGGAYVQKVEKDLVITEYNADRLLKDSLDIEVSRDGKPLQNIDYDLAPQMNEQVSVGSSGWYQYEYTIAKENFDTDGIYKISVSSKDATGNSPETANYKDKNILFRVDSTPPEIESITGLEEDIINAQNVNVKYAVYDTIGLASIKVYLDDVDGNPIDTITDFVEDLNNYSGSFTVPEKNSAQRIRLVVEDLAGNVTDTDSEEFESAYVFNKSVTVSTNAFVRFLANRTLVLGTIISVLAAVGIIILLVAKRRKIRREV